MKIVKILGGLGNQMFQYALYLSLQESFPKERVALDLFSFHGYHLHNGFELENIFSVTAQKASATDIMRIAYYYPNYLLWRVGKRLLPRRRGMCLESSTLRFDETVLTREGNRYFDGYWQDERYFAAYSEKVLKAFTFPAFKRTENLSLLEKLDENSVALHVRRGDYIGNSLYQGICDLDYYCTAIEKMCAHVTPSLFCIFSNDIAWCQQHLQPYLKAPVVYVTWNTGAESYRDRQLMSCCAHNIIANSSFSWWGAWLNQNREKVVIAPKKWLNMEECHFTLPASWIKI